MAWPSAPIVAVSEGSTDNDTLTTGSIDTSGCTLLILGLTSFVTAASTAPTDSKSNVWQLVANRDPGGAGAARVEIWVCYRPIVGSGHTFSHNVTNSYPAITVYGYDIDFVPLIPDQANSNTNASTTTLATGSVTPTLNNELLITVATINNVGWSSIDGGFTINGNIVGITGQRFTHAMAYLVQTTATAANPTWTAAGSGEATAVIMTLRSPVGTYYEEQIADDDDDAVQTDGTTAADTTDTAGSPHSLGTGTAANVPDRRIAWRFTLPDIKRNATIHVATLQLTKSGTAFSVLTATVFCEDADDAAAIGSTDLSLRAHTVGLVVDDNVNEVDDSLRHVNLTAMIQEVVNRPGWAPGGHLLVLGVGDGPSNSANKAFESFGSDSTKAARLFVDFTLATPPQSSDDFGIRRGLHRGLHRGM
jgi:hypothetical protein